MYYVHVRIQEFYIYLNHHKSVRQVGLFLMYHLGNKSSDVM